MLSSYSCLSSSPLANFLLSDCLLLPRACHLPGPAARRFATGCCLPGVRPDVSHRPPCLLPLPIRAQTEPNLFETCSLLTYRRIFFLRSFWQSYNTESAGVLSGVSYCSDGARATVIVGTTKCVLPLLASQLLCELLLGLSYISHSSDGVRVAVCFW